jgi:hypothetical protein
MQCIHYNVTNMLFEPSSRRGLDLLNQADLDNTKVMIHVYRCISNLVRLQTEKNGNHFVTTKNFELLINAI